MITYKIKSLAELAAHFEIMATEQREKSNNTVIGRPATREESFAQGNAVAYENVAYMLCNTVIEP